MTPFLASLFTVPKSSLCLGASELIKAVCTSLGIPWSVDNLAVLNQWRKPSLSLATISCQYSLREGWGLHEELLTGPDSYKDVQWVLKDNAGSCLVGFVGAVFFPILLLLHSTSSSVMFSEPCTVKRNSPIPYLEFPFQWVKTRPENVKHTVCVCCEWKFVPHWLAYCRP